MPDMLFNSSAGPWAIVGAIVLLAIIFVRGSLNYPRATMRDRSRQYLNGYYRDKKPRRF